MCMVIGRLVSSIALKKFCMKGSVKCLLQMTSPTPLHPASLYCFSTFSSFVKGVDPLGTSYKITEYLTAWSFFGLSFEWLTPLATVMAMGLIAAEFLVGVLLLTGAFRRLSAWLLVLMMVFFTCTTLVDAITNKVTDCGCFGDALKLTNWQTFWKNIALDIPTVWIFLTRDLRRKKRFERDVLITVFAIVAMVVFGLYNINNEPCIDFRPWKVGNQMMEMDAAAEVKSYVTYRNKATGAEEEFLSEELVARMEDPAWEEQMQVTEETLREINRSLVQLIRRQSFDEIKDSTF